MDNTPAKRAQEVDAATAGHSSGGTAATSADGSHGGAPKQRTMQQGEGAIRNNFARFCATLRQELSRQSSFVLQRARRAAMCRRTARFLKARRRGVQLAAEAANKSVEWKELARWTPRCGAQHTHAHAHTATCAALTPSSFTTCICPSCPPPSLPTSSSPPLICPIPPLLPQRMRPRIFLA
eukprot:5639214-Pleurochrysis_carterae.AAC.5